MGIISWVVMGLLVGILAKWIMPGKDPGGIFVTILIGIAGAFLGGSIGSFFGLGKVTGFNLGSLGLAVGGALLLLYGYRKIKKRVPLYLGHTKATRNYGKASEDEGWNGVSGERPSSVDCLRSFPRHQTLQRPAFRFAPTTLQPNHRAAQKAGYLGTRWLLPKIPENLNADRLEPDRLKAALKLNQPLAAAYYMEEDLRQAYGFRDQQFFKLKIKNSRCAAVIPMIC